MQDEPEGAAHEHARTPDSDGNLLAALSEQLPKLVLYSPIVLAILGICYDVGYFARIGFDLFPLFSLSEHLVFAMQGVPDLLGFVAAALITGAVAYTLERKAVAKPRSSETQRKSSSAAFLVGLLIGGGVASVVRFPNQWWLILAQFAYLGVWIWLTESAESQSARRIMMVGGLAFGMVLLAFGIGYAKAHAPEEGWSWSISPATISLTDGPSISGRVLRSGERGLLILNALDGTVHFRRWDNVRGIELEEVERKSWWQWWWSG